MPYLLKLLLTIIVIYYGFILIFRIILPLLIKWYIKRKLKQRGMDIDNHNNNYTKVKKDGDVQVNKINKDSKNNKNKDKDDGEYVDYEEV